MSAEPGMEGGGDLPPEDGHCLRPCDAACLDSPQADALAEDLWGTDLCCFYDGRTELCGPAVSDGQCCYAIAITGCGCDS